MTSTNSQEELGTLLDEAKKIITGERQDVYGSPENSFPIIADYWTVYLRSKGRLAAGEKIQPGDTALMMTLFKIAREAGQKSKRDNARDGAGYLDIYANRFQNAPTNK